ncbi:DUF4412 domain-containing protein [Hanstruepera marina]|uniref:DUF4412 domain-containing protein n=1 Tax=Hanstruepera marina TaxID=2873265 RepID=UPI001CA786F2|nr:DUF4412 domain-containing protein [Hanstruepera marina]
MKKLIFVLVLALNVSVFAQEKVTEGVAKSKMTMSSDNEQVQAQLAMVGETLTTTYFKGNNTRSETFNLMTGSTITIMDTAKKQMLIMADNQMVGKKYMLKSIESGEEDMKDVKVEKGDETKTILGYVCQEYNLTTTQEGTEIQIDIYVTDKISAMSNQLTRLGAEISGFPLYMEMNVSQMGMGMKITSEVTEIKKESVSDDKFDLTPLEGYEKTESLQGM